MCACMCVCVYARTRMIAGEGVCVRAHRRVCCVSTDLYVHVCVCGWGAVPCTKPGERDCVCVCVCVCVLYEHPLVVAEGSVVEGPTV